MVVEQLWGGRDNLGTVPPRCVPGPTKCRGDGGAPASAAGSTYPGDTGLHQGRAPGASGCSGRAPWRFCLLGHLEAAGPAGTGTLPMERGGKPQGN